MSTEAKQAEKPQPEEVYLDTIEDKCEVGAPDPTFDLADRTTWTVKDGERALAPVAAALVVSSQVTPRETVAFDQEPEEGAPLHRPAIDIDVPARLIPSSTPGHHHLYLDVDCTWEQYEALLKALNACGIVETGYVLAALERKATFVRLPWVKKKADQ